MTAALYPIINGTTADTDGYFEVSGNFTSVFQVGFPFVAIDSNGSPATVQSAIATTVNSSTFTGTTTQIVPDDGGGSPLTIPAPNGSYVTIAGGAYSLDRSDPAETPIVVTPGGISMTGTSLAFPGRATLNYGEFINEDMLHLLEHFASPTAPANPINGQIWYDTTNPLNKILNIYDEDVPEWVPIGAGGSEFWRDPVRVIDATSHGSLAAAESFINANPSIQGIATPLVDGDRVLFKNITSGGSPDENNIYKLIGDAGSGATLEEDDNRFPPGPKRGDATYIIEGSEAHTIYFYDETDEWVEFSGGGGGLALGYEVHLVSGVPQTIFNLTTPYSVTSDGSGLLVFVNGVKQIPDKGGPAGGGYVETDGTTVTFNAAQSVGKVVEFYILVPTTENGVAVREIRDSISGTAIVLPAGGNIDFDTITYVPGTESLLVFLNGQKAVLGRDYTEVDNDTINWIGVAVDTTGPDRFEFYSYVPVIAGTRIGDAQDVDSSASYGSPGPNMGDVLVWDGTSWTPLAPGTLSGTNYFELIAGGGETVINCSPVNTQAKAAGKAYQRVYLNGVLLREGAGGGYTVTGANQVTLIAPYAPLTALDEILVYED